ncbi:histidine kinase [Dyella sp. LX-66]|uniref:sensor histidine kinase n=1 Tax=unclassified Dyella TaxID=2634549 RepID=UPI001BE0FE09|nr:MULTISPECIES: histidine kinase [unclassified Dyella]MBT2119660.1 histidine kinase [Dyella sp. LX-1]MBT2142087.1 histidine kinase [Dyella sp. LX-66]
MTSFFFVIRLTLAWFLAFMLAVIVWNGINEGYHGPAWPFVLFCMALLGMVITGAFSHVRRVRLIMGQVNGSSLSSRQRRQIEIPFEAGEAFRLLDAAVRELPRSENVESAPDSLQLRAKVRRIDPYGNRQPRRFSLFGWFNHRDNQILATVLPGDGSSSVTLICEPCSGAWSDWFRVDDGTNLENAEGITRAITRRVAERRRGEQAAARQTATEKELTVARLNLLHAQVEPHFLYNTLASAQYLTRTDPARADEMLGHLIAYLRHSLPRTGDALSTLADELERSRAYLEILRIRMGDRLKLEIDVAPDLLATPLPPMMLQTLVENAVKHGLEPKPGGGTIWLLGRAKDDAVAITVADDGQGFSEAGSGTGIGLKNVRERLGLVYGNAASLAILANFPSGVAATLTVPTKAVAHG